MGLSSICCGIGRRCGLMNSIPQFDLALPAQAQRPWHIAVVTETYPPEVNGVAMTVAKLVEGLRIRGHRVQLVRPRQAQDCRAGGEHSDEMLVKGMALPLYRDLRLGLPSKRQLMRAWRVHRPDLVHIATEGPLGYSAVRAAKALGLATSSDFRTNFDAYTKHYKVGALEGLVRSYLRSFHNATDVTMVPTHALAHQLNAQGFQRVRVVSRGVDTERFSPDRRCEVLRGKWGLSPSQLAVTCVGRLAVEKNLDLLWKAYEAIRARHADARLIIVGDGPMRQTLQRRWPDAVFCGAQYGEALAAHYASADLFLFPSKTETFGNVVTEALASGLPSVAFRHAAAAQLYPQYACGMLAELQDDVGFIEAAVSLADDADQRAQLQVRARDAALALDWPSVVGRAEDVMRTALLGEVHRQEEGESSHGRTPSWRSWSGQSPT